MSDYYEARKRDRKRVSNLLIQYLTLNPHQTLDQLQTIFAMEEDPELIKSTLMHLGAEGVLSADKDWKWTAESHEVLIDH